MKPPRLRWRDNAALPLTGQIPAERDYFTLRDEVDHYAKQLEGTRSILMSSADRARREYGRNPAIIVYPHALPAEYKCPK